MPRDRPRSRRANGRVSAVTGVDPSANCLDSSTGTRTPRAASYIGVMSASPFFQHVRQLARGPMAELARESWLVRAERCRMAAEAALPDTSVELYFNLGPTGRHLSGCRPRAALPPRSAWVVGPRARPLFIEKETRDCDIVAIRLVPWIAHRVLGVPA